MADVNNINKFSVLVLVFFLSGCNVLDSATRYSSYRSASSYRSYTPRRYSYSYSSRTYRSYKPTYRAPTRYSSYSYSRSYYVPTRYTNYRSPASTYRSRTSTYRASATRSLTYYSRIRKATYTRRYYSSLSMTPYLAMYSNFIGHKVYASRSYKNSGTTWCKNYDYVNGTQLGMFRCPLPFEPSDYTYCCGYSQAEYCCRLWDSPGNTAGVVIGIIIGVFIIALIIGCCTKRYIAKNKAKVTPHSSTVSVTHASGRPVNRPINPHVRTGQPASRLIQQPATGVPIYPPPLTDPAYPPQYPPPSYSSLMMAPPSGPPPAYVPSAPPAPSTSFTPSPFIYQPPP